MDVTFHELTRGLKSVPGATKAAIDDLVARLGYDLPDDYLEFMKTSNGAEGAMSESSYLVIWPVVGLGSGTRFCDSDSYSCEMPRILRSPKGWAGSSSSTRHYIGRPQKNDNPRIEGLTPGRVREATIRPLIL